MSTRLCLLPSKWWSSFEMSSSPLRPIPKVLDRARFPRVLNSIGRYNLHPRSVFLESDQGGNSMVGHRVDSTEFLFPTATLAPTTILIMSSRHILRVRLGLLPLQNAASCCPGRVLGVRSDICGRPKQGEDVQIAYDTCPSDSQAPCQASR